MNYLAEIKAFHDMVAINRLSSGQIALWHALMSVNNKCAWIEWFTVSSQVLVSASGLSRKAVYNARNVLKQKGYIDFKETGNGKASLYKINTLSNTTQDTTQVCTQDTTQDTTQVCTQDTTPLNKLNQTKHIHAQNAVCTDTLFEKFWAAYPRKVNKSGALKAFTKLKADDELLNTMLSAINREKNGTQWQKDGGQFIPHPTTWLNQRRWESVTAPPPKSPWVGEYQA